MQSLLAQDPWGYLPEQIGRLTDLQIVKLYIEPAVERAKELRKDSPATPSGQPVGSRPDREASTGPTGEPGSKEHRAQVVQAFMDVMGMNKERANAKYDQQLAQWYAQQGSK